eukprot:COSAG01_NODE_25488_length_743_cov_1.520186_1_plen_42_part_10
MLRPSRPWAPLLLISVALSSAGGSRAQQRALDVRLYGPAPTS